MSLGVSELEGNWRQRWFATCATFVIGWLLAAAVLAFGLQRAQRFDANRYAKATNEVTELLETQVEKVESALWRMRVLSARVRGSDLGGV